MKRGRDIQVPKKTVGQQFAEDLFTLALTCTLIYVITGFFKCLFSPLKYLVMSSEDIDKEEIEKAKEKIKIRKAREESLKNDPANLMNFCATRLDSKDPENQDYIEWYKDWKAGKILDSKLQWSPPVYKDHSFNSSFLRYLGTQINLHRESNWASRVIFLKTIRDFYPEFSPNLDSMKIEIEKLCDRNKIKEIKQDIIGEIQKLGIPKECADYLTENYSDGKELRKLALSVKKCIERGYSGDASLTIARFNYDPKSTQADIINRIIDMGLTEKVALAAAEMKISIDEVGELIETSKCVAEYGSVFMVVEAVNDHLKEILQNKAREF